MSHARTLVAGAVIAVTAVVLTHPLAVLACLALAYALAARSGVLERAPLLARVALGLGLSVLAFNALFSWNGATVLWRAPFRVAMLGRPLVTLEAITWGAVAGVQLAATVLALGTATLAVPPETFHRALTRLRLPRTLATSAGLALRLVPDTTRDAQAMRKAIRLRGIPTEGARGTAHVLVPLTARALDRALVAEEALVARGYDTTRGARVGGPLPRVAWAGLAGAAAALAVALVGPGRIGYYPTLQLAGALDAGAVLALMAALVVPLILVVGVRPSSS